jgi:EpsI family protein
MDRARAKWIAAVIIALAGIGARTLRATEPRDPGPLQLASARIEPGVAYVDETLDPGFEDALRAREILYRTYAPESDTPVWVFMAYFDRQREGSQVHSPRHCYPGAGWSIEAEIDTTADWRPGRVTALVVSNGSQRRLVCYWYQTPATILTDVMQLKLFLTRDAVLRKPQDVVFANVSTPVGDGMASAFRRLLPLARASEQQVRQLYEERDERRTGVH